MITSAGFQKRLFVLPLMLMTLGACSQEKRGKEIDCFPPDARNWVYLSKGDGQVTRFNSETKFGEATIYIDHSVSMIGYLQGANQFARPFQDLVGDLPKRLKQLNAQPSFRSFGKSISEPMSGAAPLFDPNFYSCAGKAAGTCDSTESHLDKVLEEVAGNTNGFAVIVSDLWYDNSGDPMSGVTAIQPHLIKILSEGRTVALYGIKAPFKGDIYDLPVSETEKTKVTHQGQHPFYVMVIGPKANVLEFDNNMFALGPKFLEAGLADGTVHKSFFMVDPGPLTQRVRNPFSAGRLPRVRTVAFEAHPGIAIQQFTISRGSISRGSMAKPGAVRPQGPTWTGPKESADMLVSDFIPASVWMGDLKGSLRVYKRLNDQCKATSWQLWRTVPLDNPVNGQFSVSLDPDRVELGLGQPGVYALVGQIERTSVISENPANDWIRQWSVDSPRAAMLVAHPPMNFPTLNVADVARIMEKSLDQAARQKGGGIVGFTALVKVED